jgi:hypothetical protein
MRLHRSSQFAATPVTFVRFLTRVAGTADSLLTRRNPWPHVLPIPPADREHPAVKPSQMQEDKLGAFRELGFAILFQTSLGALALAA